MPTDLSHVRFGTSSWAYEGWQGLVYQRTYPKNRFSQDALAEYAIYRKDGIPMFRTVGIDHSFYRPASAVQLARYASQVPDDFRFCSKVWEDITIPVYANLPRYGARAGKANPRFLDAGAFRDMVWAPAQEGLGSKLGPFIFEFQRWGWEPADFLQALTDFSVHCRLDYSTQQKSAIPRFLVRGIWTSFRLITSPMCTTIGRPCHHSPNSIACSSRHLRLPTS
jgi:uncharacterized protein YecE (DUF72 family)